MTRLSTIIFSVAFTCVCLLPSTLKGETVSRKYAESVAEAFFREHGEESVKLKIAFDGRRFSTHRLFPPFYVFNNTSGGFVIVSADNKAYPVLGYSLSGEFKADRMPEAMSAILGKYAKEIENIRHDGRIPLKAIEAWRNPFSGPFGEVGESEMFNMSAEGVSDLIWLRHSSIEYPDVYPLSMEEEPEEMTETSEEPFSLYTDFLNLIEKERNERERMFDLRLNPETPFVVTEGGGHFSLNFPEKIILCQIFNLSGMMVDRIKVSDSEQVMVNISREPFGLYILVASAQSGKRYYLKLWR